MYMPSGRRIGILADNQRRRPTPPKNMALHFMHEHRTDRGSVHGQLRANVESCAQPLKPAGRAGSPAWNMFNIAVIANKDEATWNCQRIRNLWCFRDISSTIAAHRKKRRTPYASPLHNTAGPCPHRGVKACPPYRATARSCAREADPRERR